MNIAYMGIALLSLVAIEGPSSCAGVPDSDQKQSAQQEVMLAQATGAIGMPAITNFQERRMLKQILELRDTAVTTVTYITDLSGHLHKVCDSIGYGLPYATQYTNPGKPIGESEHTLAILPQADPNGLFSPASAEGTWINCLNPTTKSVQVVYIEPRVIVSPFALSVP